YEVRFFANKTFQRLGTTPTVTVAPPPPLTVNGSSGANTQAPSATVSERVRNGPGNPTGRVALYPTGTADTAYVDWFFLNGTKSAPAVGLTTATVPFTLPNTPGTYEVRFFVNNTYQRLGTAPTVTVKWLAPSNLNGTSR